MEATSLSLIKVEKNFAEGLSDAVSSWIGKKGDKPNYIVITVEQALWFSRNFTGKKIKMKSGQVMKIAGMTAIVVECDC